MRYYVRIPKKQINLLKKNNQKLKRYFEETTNVKLNINDSVSFDTDDPILALSLQQVLKAFGRGFAMKDALDLLDDKYGLEIIDITEYVGKSKSRLTTMRGRIIGTDGKTKKTIENYTDTKIAVSGKTVSIIGEWKKIKIARRAIEMLLQGAMHSTVYRWLEQVI
jgi:ribosomal RNA assembly protein